MKNNKNVNFAEKIIDSLILVTKLKEIKILNTYLKRNE